MPTSELVTVLWTYLFTLHFLSSVSLHILCLGLSQETPISVGEFWGVTKDLEVKFSLLRIGTKGMKN